MKYIVILLLPLVCLAKENLKVEKLYIEADKAIFTNRHYAIPKGEKKKGSLNLGLQIGYGFVYSKSIINSFYTDSQFRYIDLDQELGFRLNRYFDIYAKHKSEHTMDYYREDDFQNNNSIGLRFHIVQ